MAFTVMAFSPSDGLANTTTYVTEPASETAARAQIQAPMTQLQTAINGLIDELEDTDTGTSGAESVGSAAISGVTGTTVRAQISDLKTQIDAVTAGAVANGTITTAKLDTDAVTGAKVADDAIDSEHIADGAIDTAHLSADCVDGTKIADDSIDSEHYVDGSIDEAHLSAGCVTESKIGTAAVTAAKIYDGTITAAKLNGDVYRMSGSNLSIGTHANDSITTGNANTSLGYDCGTNITSGYWNTGIGYRANLYCNTANYCTALGHNALGANSSYSNCTGVGNGAEVTAANQVQLGNSDTTTYAYGAVQNRSDERDKADIKDTELGLDFIMALKPRQFKWDYREDYTGQKDGSKKRTREHQGFIAQEVKATMDELGIDFAGYQDHSIGGGKDVLSLGYMEFIAPLVKAIQDQQKLIDELRAKVGV